MIGAYFLPKNKKGKCKMKILIFLIGFILGGMTGIVCMCMVQINRHTENELRQEEINNEALCKDK